MPVPLNQLTLSLERQDGLFCATYYEGFGAFSSSATDCTLAITQVLDMARQEFGYVGPAPKAWLGKDKIGIYADTPEVDVLVRSSFNALELHASNSSFKDARELA